MELVLMSQEERTHRRSKLNDYLFCHIGLNRIYAYKYIFCEFLCLINVMGQIWYNDWFFDGQFLTYGLEVLRRGSQGLESALAAAESQPNISVSPNESINTHTAEARLHPMLLMFPRITKCTFYDYGSSGDIQRKNALCLLPMNVLNEKIYLGLWVWYLVLFVLLLVVITYRMLLLFSVQWRAHCLRSRCPLSNENDLLCICKLGDIGDWFFWYMLAANLEPLMMAEITSEMAHRLTKTRHQTHFGKNNSSPFSRLSSTSSCSIKDLLKNATAGQQKKSSPFAYDVEKGAAESADSEDHRLGTRSWLNIDQRNLCNARQSTDSGVSNGSSSKWSWFNCASAPVDPDYELCETHEERTKSKPSISFQPINESTKTKPKDSFEQAFINHKCQNDTIRRVVQLCGQPLDTTTTPYNKLTHEGDLRLIHHSASNNTPFDFGDERNGESFELRKRRSSLYKRELIRHKRCSLKRKVGKVVAQAVVSPINSGRASAASLNLSFKETSSRPAVNSSYKPSFTFDKTPTTASMTKKPTDSAFFNSPSSYKTFTTTKSKTDQLCKASLKSNNSSKRPR